MPRIAPMIETDDNNSLEIDWNGGSIGLQYGKIKHAARKPRVLITTYQSLARDSKNTTYPPEEYGLVIYDEGHVITAPIFGQSVDKFSHAFQLAVTATPEYTKKKTVSAKLPMLYFKLPLVEAINRGDLCNVRPAIVKTGYHINADQFHRFMSIQNETPLNTEQLEMLLNQEARNRAVVKTYFLGCDPDSGQRYLGQNGMIFCTGIRHAEAMVEIFHSELKKDDGQQVQSWLDDVGVELIASVHGGCQGAFLKKGLLAGAIPDTRTYSKGHDGAEREWYSEEEIFDLHETGKILLLVSVAKLKWGFDSPKDSLLFDLADRFSKVDATQIYGRVFRLDPEAPEKTATVFNLMDENTLDLYANFPKLMPIYCAEVIDGAEFRPPARRARAHVKYRNAPPNLQKKLEDFGFHVLTDIRAVRAISAESKKKRDAALARAPDQEPDWMSARGMERAYMGKATTYEKLMREYAGGKEQEFIDQGMNPQEAAALVDRDFVGVRTSNNRKQALCASRDVVAAIINGRGMEKEPNWISGNGMGEKYGGTAQTYEALMREYARGKEREFIDQGMNLQEAAALVDRDFVGLRRISSQTALCASPVAVADIMRIRTPTKDSGWMSAYEMQKRFGEGPEIYLRLMSEYEAQKRAELVESGMNPQEADALIAQGFVGRRKVRGKDTLCASSAVVNQIIQNRLPNKEPDWMSGAAMAREYGGSAATYEKLMRSYAKEKERSLLGQEADPQAAAARVDRNSVGLRASDNGKPILCASPEVIAAIMHHRAPAREPSWMSVREMEKQFGSSSAMHERRLKDCAAQKQESLVAQGMAPQEAAAWVDKNFVGIRTSGNGKSALCASPEAVAEVRGWQPRREAYRKLPDERTYPSV